MNFIEFILFLVIAGVAGGLAQALTGVRGNGCFATVALGFVGALLGTILAQSLSLPAFFIIQIGEQPFPIVWAILGASLFVIVLTLLSRRKASPYA